MFCFLLSQYAHKIPILIDGEQQSRYWIIFKEIVQLKGKNNYLYKHMSGRARLKTLVSNVRLETNFEWNQKILSTKALHSEKAYLNIQNVFSLEILDRVCKYNPPASRSANLIQCRPNRFSCLVCEFYDLQSVYSCKNS